MDLWLLFQNVALIDPSTHFACLPNRSSHLLLYISSIRFVRRLPFIPALPLSFRPPPSSRTTMPPNFRLETVATPTMRWVCWSDAL